MKKFLKRNKFLLGGLVIIIISFTSMMLFLSETYTVDKNDYFYNYKLNHFTLIPEKIDKKK